VGDLFIVDQGYDQCYNSVNIILAIRQTRGKYMNQINWLDVFNSSLTFWMLAAIAFGILLLVAKKDSKSKSPKRR